MLGAAVLGVVVPAFLLFDFPFLSNLPASNRPVIGQIQYLKKDTRTRSADSLTWVEAKPNQAIHIGDGIYCGDESSAIVRLTEGSVINVGEKSLIYLRNEASKKVVDLDHGNFRIQINGEIKLAVGNSIISLEGNGSDVQILKDPKTQAKIKLLSGNARISTANKPTIDLARDNLVQVDLMGQINSVGSTDLSEHATLMTNETPDLASKPEPVIHIWQLRDLYESNGPQLKERPSPLFIPTSMNLSWLMASSAPSKLIVELGNSEDFENTIRFFGEPRALIIDKVFDGNNFIRASYDGLKFSYPQKFVAHAEFLANAKPLAVADTLDIILLDDQTPVGITLTSPIAEMGFIAQASSNPQFENSEIFWTQESRLIVSVLSPGYHYYRFRSINAKNEISEWSEPLVINAIRPDLPKAPPLAKLKRNRKTNKYDSPQIEKSSMLERAPTSELRKNEEPALASISTQLNETRSTHHSSNYNKSQLSLEGFAWTIYGSQQASSELPLTTGLGVRLIHWLNKLGLEGILKSGVLGLNQAAKETSFQDLEARLHYRFFTGFPWSLAKELQVSLFAGAEIYKNSGLALSNGYDLFKFGTALEFPWGQSWLGGGEFTGGYGFDGSRKYEVSGHVGYFIDSKWSLGVGYKIHLFEAGSTKTAAQGVLPYREGYTEGYSILNYHF